MNLEQYPDPFTPDLNTFEQRTYCQETYNKIDDEVILLNISTNGEKHIFLSKTYFDEKERWIIEEVEGDPYINGDDSEVNIYDNFKDALNIYLVLAIRLNATNEEIMRMRRDITILNNTIY